MLNLYRTRYSHSQASKMANNDNSDPHQIHASRKCSSVFLSKVARTAIMLTALAVLASCGSVTEPGAMQSVTATAEPTVAPPTDTTGTPTAAPVPELTSEDPLQSVNVYWSWSIPTVPTGSPERLGASTRDVNAADAARGAVEALLDGPNAVETEIGMSSNVPAGTELLDLSISGGTATVDLSNDFEESGGTLGETFRLAQVAFTLTQFAEVDAVMFRIDGADVTEVGSHGFDVSSGVDRSDFTGVRPAILVEAPAPGSKIGDGTSLRGESNTFEATVEWVVADKDGLIVAEGFTTATAGSGTWGAFNVASLDLPSGLTGLGALIVFETSAKDGSQINVVEYPVTFDPAALGVTG